MLIKKLSIIIPVYNEEKTVYLILQRIKEIHLINDIEKEIIIVNDNSSDNTEITIQNFIASNPYMDITYLKSDTNKGKGASIHVGIEKATGEYLIIQDA